MTTLNAEKLSLGEVERLLGFQRQPLGAYVGSMTFESLTDYEYQELIQIARDFENYLVVSKISEGLIKALTTYPLLRLAGFYRFPVELQLEEMVERIEVEDEGAAITGRLDILAINKTATVDGKAFWILIVEAKNSSIDISAGLPQLLIYAYKSLSYQDSVWGLVTNGLNQQFVYIQQGDPPTYQLLPPLYLLEHSQAVQLLQALKAICQLQRQPNPAIA